MGPNNPWPLATAGQCNPGDGSYGEKEITLRDLGRAGPGAFRRDRRCACRMITDLAASGGKRPSTRTGSSRFGRHSRLGLAVVGRPGGLAGDEARPVIGASRGGAMMNPRLRRAYERVRGVTVQAGADGALAPRVRRRPHLGGRHCCRRAQGRGLGTRRPPRSRPPGRGNAIKEPGQGGHRGRRDHRGQWPPRAQLHVGSAHRAGKHQNP
jgi:hypothetical protein